MEERPSYFAIIPASVRYDTRLKPIERLLYGEITCLTNKDGYCYASSTYFAELYETSRETISRYISNLATCGYIIVEIENGYQRKIFLKEGVTKLSQGGVTKSSQGCDETITGGCDETITHNNTSINNIINNNEKKEELTDFEEVAKEYEKRFPMTLSSYKTQQLADLMANYGKDAVLFGIREAHSTNAQKPIPYIRSVAMNVSRKAENEVPHRKKDLEAIGKQIKDNEEKQRAEGNSLTAEEMRKQVIENMKRKGMTIVGTGNAS